MSGINLGKKRRAGAAIYLYVLYLVGRTDGLLSLGSRRSSTSTAPHERTAAAAVCSRRRVQEAAVFGTNLKTDRRGNGSSRGAPIRIRGNTHTHAGCRYGSGLRKRVFLSLSTALGERAWGSKPVPPYLPTTPRRRMSARHGYMLHANPACVRVGTWVHPTDLPNRRPGFSPPPSISTGSCRQPQQPAPLIPISFSNGNEDSSFFLQQVFFLAGHFLLDLISFGVSLHAKPLSGVREHEVTRARTGMHLARTRKRWSVARPGPKLGIPRRRIGRSFDGFQGQLFLGVLWGGGRCRLSFFFPSFSWSSSRGCVETTTSTTSIPGPVTPLPIETRWRS